MALPGLISLPFNRDPVRLNVNDIVELPYDFWKYSTDLVNSPQFCGTRRKNSIWSLKSADDVNPTSMIKVAIKWIGTLPNIAPDSQLFAGIETLNDTVSLLDLTYDIGFPCDNPKSALYLPAKFLAMHHSDCINSDTESRLYDKQHNNGAGLIITDDLTNEDSNCFIELFKCLKYQVHNYTMADDKKVKEIKYDMSDGIICFISSMQHDKVNELVSTIIASSSLRHKPKLFFVQSFVKPSSSTSDDVYIAWINSSCTSQEYTPVNLLYTVIKDNVLSCDFNALMEKVLAITHMFLPQTKQWLVEITSTLKKRLMLFSNYSHILHQALIEGPSIRAKWTKVSVSGPPECGRSSFINQLVNNDQRPAKDKAKAEIVSVISEDNSGESWKETSESYIRAIIADKIKRTAQIEKPAPGQAPMVAEGTDDDDCESPAICGSPTAKELLMNELPSPVIKKPLAISNEPHCIFIVNSGGTPAFLKIAPIFRRFNSVNIVIHDLSKRLEDKAAFHYHINEKSIVEPENRHLTHLQHIEKTFRSFTAVDSFDLSKNCKCLELQSRIQPPSYCLLVLGTFYDVLEQNSGEKQSLDEKNQMLYSTLKSFSSYLRKYDCTNDEIIFPINTQQVSETIKTIRKQVCHYYFEADIPARWFLFQLDLMSTKSVNFIISLKECEKIGSKLKMKPSDVTAALMYFHDLTIILYFHNFLPDVIFLHPQPLIDKLSEVIGLSFPKSRDFMNLKDVVLQPNALKKLKFKGCFDEELLECLPSGFSNDFDEKKFLNLMTKLFIFAHLPPKNAPTKNEYFFPSVLPLADSEEIQEWRAIHTQETDSLIFTWASQMSSLIPLPEGLFYLLVMELLEENFVLDKDEDRQYYSNAISLANDRRMDGGILLIDSVYWLEVCYSGDQKNCALVKQIIHEKLKALIRKFNYGPLLNKECYLCFQCSCNNPVGKFHLCRLTSNNNKLTCCQAFGKPVGGIDESRQLPWLGVYKAIPKVELATLLEKLANVSHVWEPIGIALEVENHIIMSTRQNEYTDMTRLSRVLQAWIVNDKDVTWDKIIKVLESNTVGNVAKANEIRSFVKQGVPVVAAPESTDVQPIEDSSGHQSVLKPSDTHSGHQSIPQSSGGAQSALPKDTVTPVLKDLLTFLAKHADSYTEIAKKLKYPERKLDQLKNPKLNSETKLRTILMWWLKHGEKYSPVTWKTIADAMKTISYGTYQKIRSEKLQ